VEETEASLRKLKCGKAGGFDGLQLEHLKYSGPLLTLWLKQIFCAFAHFEYVPSSLLTGLIRPIYKGKGKDPLSCHSNRGIIMTPVVMKVFEYTFLTEYSRFFKEMVIRLLPKLLIESTSHQNAIFATQEAIVHTLQGSRVAYLSLYDLEKAFDSVEHSILLQSLYQAGINGKAWRLIKVLASSASIAEEQSLMISDFASQMACT